MKKIKKDFELKTVSTKKVFKIPYLWIKQSKYEKNIYYSIKYLLLLSQLIIKEIQ